MKPSEPGYRELFEVLARAGEAFDSMDAAEREHWMSGHPSSDFLRAYAEGRLRYHAVQDETRHLIYCSVCAGEVQRFEKQHVEKLRSEQDIPVYLPVGEYYVPEEEYAAAASSIPEPPPDAVAPVLHCRAFQVDLMCRQNAVVL